MLLLGGVVSVAALAYLLAVTLFGVKPDVHAAMTVADWAFVAGSVFVVARAIVSGFRSVSTTQKPAQKVLAAAKTDQSSHQRSRGFISLDDGDHYGIALMPTPRVHIQNYNFED